MMIPLDWIDGEVADWLDVSEARCLCDVKAGFVLPLGITMKQFQQALVRLNGRRAARAKFVADRIASEQGRQRRFAVIDPESNFALHDEFEDIHGRDPLEAFVNDVEEVFHHELGRYFSSVTRSGSMTSPMNAGDAITIRPSRSFADGKRLIAFKAGKKASWRPSVRVEVAFLVAGRVKDVLAEVSRFAPAMAACGPLVSLEWKTRKPDLSGVPLYAPRPMLAPVQRDGAREA